ncbi:hypothetical protein, partial [Mycolicibacterium conceptionense]|uniref:hypothetical protein n=1 Tax=Mycolicibacterium conceptionense TaxID=451644 RepID=UPI001A9646D1
TTRLWWIPKGAAPTEGTYVRIDHNASGLHDPPTIGSKLRCSKFVRQTSADPDPAAECVPAAALQGSAGARSGGLRRIACRASGPSGETTSQLQ